MEHKNTNMKIDWDLEKANLNVIFIYPNVCSKCIDEKNNIWSDSSKIIGDAIRDHFKGTKIRWINGSCGKEGQILELKIDQYDKISFPRLNDILLKLDTQIRTEIYNLINPI